MKKSIIERLRKVQLVSKFDTSIHFSDMYKQDSTRFAFTIVESSGKVALFVEVAWLKDVENDRYIFQVVETDTENVEYEYKTYHFDRLIDNLLETFERFDIYPKDYLGLM